MTVNLNFTQFGGRQALDLTGVILAFIASKYLDGKSPPPVNVQWANHTNPAGGQTVLEISGGLTSGLESGDYYFNITALNPDGTVATYAAGTWPITPTPGSISGSAPTVPPVLGPGYVKEAPNDGEPYQRQSQAWVVNPVTEAPEDGNVYGRKNGLWSNLETAAAGVPEAPLLGGPYLRQNAAWVVDPVVEAPTDGQSYVRNHAAWLALTGYVTEAPGDGGTYGRKNGAWVATIPDAPVSASTYGRYQNAWVAILGADAPANSTTYGRNNNAWTGVVNKAGDTMTGTLVLSSGANLQLSNGTVIIGGLTLNTASGELLVTAQSGPNAGKSVNLTAGKWA